MALTIKGGPFKGERGTGRDCRGLWHPARRILPTPGFILPTGCFHVPRCLAMCEQILGALLQRLEPAPLDSSPAVSTHEGSK